MSSIKEYMITAESHFPMITSHVRDGRRGEQFDRAAALLLGKQAHRDQGDEKQPDHVDIGEQRPHDLLVDVHRKLLAFQRGFHGHVHEIAHGIPEEEAENDGEHDEQDVGDRRHEVAAKFLAANDPDISH